MRTFLAVRLFNLNLYPKFWNKTLYISILYLNVTVFFAAMVNGFMWPMLLGCSNYAFIESKLIEHRLTSDHRSRTVSCPTYLKLLFIANVQCPRLKNHYLFQLSCRPFALRIGKLMCGNVKKQDLLCLYKLMSADICEWWTDDSRTKRGRGSYRPKNWSKVLCLKIPEYFWYECFTPEEPRNSVESLQTLSDITNVGYYDFEMFVCLCGVSTMLVRYKYTLAIIFRWC